jgi:hypothetical protein
MRSTEARDLGDALDDRPVLAVWPRLTRVGNEKYLGGFWIIEAADLDVALKPRCETVGRARSQRGCPAMASMSRIVHSWRTRKS